VRAKVIGLVSIQVIVGFDGLEVVTGGSALKYRLPIYSIGDGYGAVTVEFRALAGFALAAVFATLPTTARGCPEDLDLDDMVGRAA
jgi:hypothetical protein